MNAPVECPVATCAYQVPVPVEQMVAQTYRMDGDGQITMGSVPQAVLDHLATHITEDWTLT